MNPIHTCRNLRNKGMYVPGLVEDPSRETGEQEQRSSHCWCNLSLTEVGPDDKPVGPAVCKPTRSCFEK